MRVLLDTNVVLSGALRPASPAGQLSTVRDSVSFMVSDLVMHECRRVLREAAGGRNTRYRLAVLTVERYLQDIGALLLPDHVGEDPPAKADLRIHATALSYGCHAICTYNPRDFPNGQVETVSPHGLKRRYGPDVLEKFVQVPILGEAGTLFFMGTLHHHSAMGNILEAGNGLRVFADENGYVQVGRPNAPRVNVTAPLVGMEVIAFFLRYTQAGQFKASLWFPEGTSKNWFASERFQERVLTTGQVRFEPPLRPCLGDGSFYGVVLGYSGVPHYVRDNMIPYAIHNLCLEAVWGGEDIAILLQSCVVGQTSDDRWFLGLPRY